MSPAQVVAIDSHPAFRYETERTCSKKELAIRWGKSTKTIERMMDRGLPFSRDESGYARFIPSECDRWRREEAL